MSKYTDWVRTLPCAVTGTISMQNVDPHHIKGYNWLTGGGKGFKGKDLLCMPLRNDLHRELHDIGWESWEEKYNRSQLEEVFRTIVRAVEEDVITINI